MNKLTSQQIEMIEKFIDLNYRLSKDGISGVEYDELEELAFNIKEQTGLELKY